MSSNTITHPKQQIYIQLFVPDLYNRIQSIETKFEKQNKLFQKIYTSPQLYFVSNEGEFQQSPIKNDVFHIDKEYITSMEYECKNHRLYGNCIQEHRTKVDIIPFFHKPYFQQTTYYTLHNENNTTNVSNELVYFVFQTLYIPYSKNELQYIENDETLFTKKEKQRFHDTIHELPNKILEHTSFNSINCPKEQWKIIHKYYFIVNSPDLDNPLIHKHLEKYMRCFF